MSPRQKDVKTITIKAPLATVFDFLKEPKNRIVIWPNVTDVTDIRTLPNGGYRFRCTHELAGLSLRCISDDIECISNQCIVTRIKGGVQGTIVFTFQPDGKCARVSVETSWTVPLPLLRTLAEAVIMNQNDFEAESLLLNLKSCVEREELQPSLFHRRGGRN